MKQSEVCRAEKSWRTPSKICDLLSHFTSPELRRRPAPPMEASLLTSSSSRLPLLLARITDKSRVRVSAGARCFPFSNTSFPLSAPRQPRAPLPTNQAALFSSRDDDGNGTVPAETREEGRIGEVKRVTKETNVHVKLNLDGSGIADCITGIPFLDHMLDQLASHGILDMYVRASGDIHIDDHHTNEDIALAIGTALLRALGDRKGIYRFGHFAAPLDEAVVEVILPAEHLRPPLQTLPLQPPPVLHLQQLEPSLPIGAVCSRRPSRSHRLLSSRPATTSPPPARRFYPSIQDLSGRPHLSCDLQIPTERVGSYDTQLVEHFFQSLVNTSGMTLHIHQLAGKNSHHIIEATFKAFARALRQAIEYDIRRSGTIPSSKGVLSRS